MRDVCNRIVAVNIGDTSEKEKVQEPYLKLLEQKGSIQEDPDAVGEIEKKKKRLYY